MNDHDRPMSMAEGLAHLNAGGNLSVPCSRYGDDTATCAPVAWFADYIVSIETGEPQTVETLDYTMGLVVNDSDDIEHLIEENNPMCRWFAMCENPASHMEPHPAFRQGVPTCDRCGERIAAMA